MTRATSPNTSTWVMRWGSRSTGIAIATLGVSVAGLLRESSVASALGLGTALDGLVTALGLLLLVGSAMISTASAALLPELARRLRGVDESPRELAGASIALGLLAGGVLAVALSAGSAVLAGIVGGDDAVVVDTVGHVLRSVAPLFITASTVRGVMISILQAADVYTIPAGVQIISSSFMAIAALVIEAPSPVALVSWFSIGIVAEVGVLGAVAWKRVVPRLASVGVSRLLIGPILPRAAYSLLATVVFGLNPVIDFAIANQLDEGSAGRLSIAGRLPLAAAALLVAVLVTPAFTRLSEAYGVGGRLAVSSEFRRRLRRIVAAGLVAAIGASTIGFLVAHLFFSSGELTTGDANKIAGTQVVYALTIPPYVAGVMASRALQAANRQRTQLVAGLLGAAANVGLDIVLGSWFGVNGIAAATCVVYCLTFAFMYAWVRTEGPYQL